MFLSLITLVHADCELYVEHTEDAVTRVHAPQCEGDNTAVWAEHWRATELDGRAGAFILVLDETLLNEGPELPKTDGGKLERPRGTVPRMPAEAKRDSLSGVCRVHVVVDEEGHTSHTFRGCAEIWQAPVTKALRDNRFEAVDAATGGETMLEFTFRPMTEPQPPG